jgi:hypothetical protein
MLFEGEQLVDMLYSTGANYNYTVNDVQGANTFTMMMWRACTQIGVGVAGDQNGDIFVVILYTPKGNVIGSFTSNVFPLVLLRRK